jgi:hypothetical protein
MYNYTLSILQAIKRRNSDVGENNCRVVQVTFYNYNRYAGANKELNSIVFFTRFTTDLLLLLILKTCVDLVALLS